MPIAKCEKYVDLVNEFLPRPIESEADFIAVQQVVDELLDAGEIFSIALERGESIGLRRRSTHPEASHPAASSRHPSSATVYTQVR